MGKFFACYLRLALACRPAFCRFCSRLAFSHNLASRWGRCGRDDHRAPLSGSKAFAHWASRAGDATETRAPEKGRGTILAAQRPTSVRRSDQRQ
jgi:hypothetical protein